MSSLIEKQHSWQQYEAAHHLLYVTYPVIKDPKLLQGIMKNIFSSLEHGLNALFFQHRASLPTDFRAKLALFHERYVSNQIFPYAYFDFLLKIKELIDFNQSSTVDFRKDNCLFMCSHDYHLKHLQVNDVKGYLDQTKEFLEIMERIITK